MNSYGWGMKVSQVLKKDLAECSTGAGKMFGALDCQPINKGGKMRVLSGLAILVLLAIVPAPLGAVTLSPYEYGIAYGWDDWWSEEEDCYQFSSGIWHVQARDKISVFSDAGYFSYAYALFDLSSLTETAERGVHLSFEIFKHVGFNWPYPMAIHDLNDIAALRPPADWPGGLSFEEYMASYHAVREDLSSGVLYGNFLVPTDSEGMIINVLLTNEAVASINASLGGLWGIGIGPDETFDGTFPGEGFPSEGAGVTLGNAQLHVSPVPEPATLMLLGAGLAGIGGFHRRARHKKPGR